ncbi:MAG TPA: alpha/beta fold hydrolase [Terriglobales bacterium]|nr:alpha/beta fold hydrolase [Terriglobales bacterium]
MIALVIEEFRSEIHYSGAQKFGVQKRARMRDVLIGGGLSGTALLLTAALSLSVQPSPTAYVDEHVLSEYAGVYQWGPDAFVYLQLWNEFSGFNKPGQLVAFDESGQIRVLYPTDHDKFFVGDGIAVAKSIASRIEFGRDAKGKIASLMWYREGAPPRIARRVLVEKCEDVGFANGGMRLSGTLRRPSTSRKVPAVILVHGSGAEDRDYVLPFAHFLVRRGIAVLGYDKRGVGASTGDWRTASFEDLAGDVVAAFDYLKTRSDIEPAQIGLLAVSQAGWVMPIAAVRAPDIAFLISISGAGVSPAETSLDNARNEMTAAGRRPDVINQILNLMRLQYRFAETGDGWEEYIAARQQLANRFGGNPPPNFPGDRHDPLWLTMRAFYFYDPGPNLQRLRTPTLAIWGELDKNILPEKNKGIWEAALKAAANPDYTLRILPKANHFQWEAKNGSNAEMSSLNGFVPDYFATVEAWLSKRIRGFRAAK